MSSIHLALESGASDNLDELIEVRVSFPGNPLQPVVPSFQLVVGPRPYTINQNLSSTN